MKKFAKSVVKEALYVLLWTTLILNGWVVVEAYLMTLNSDQVTWRQFVILLGLFVFFGIQLKLYCKVNQWNLGNHQKK